MGEVFQVRLDDPQPKTLKTDPATMAFRERGDPH